MKKNVFQEFVWTEYARERTSHRLGRTSRRGIVFAVVVLHLNGAQKRKSRNCITA